MIEYKVERYIGTKIGKGGFLERRGWQVVAYDTETKKRKYVFRTIWGEKTPCFKFPFCAYHYKTGFNKLDAERDSAYNKEAEVLARNLNESQDTERGCIIRNIRSFS